MTRKPECIGFGFFPTETEHHFLVTVPAGATSDALISEHYIWDGEENLQRALKLELATNDAGLRCALSRPRWEAIADEVKAEFNRRLRSEDVKPGKWKTGSTPLSHLLGKEIALLAWAIEDADPALIPTAIRNWQGLTPEERWWLYTMTNAASGHFREGRNKGWRKAVRYALTENPVSDAPRLLDRNTFGVSVTAGTRGRLVPRKKGVAKGPSLFDESGT